MECKNKESKNSKSGARSYLLGRNSRDYTVLCIAQIVVSVVVVVVAASAAAVVVISIFVPFHVSFSVNRRRFML